LRHRAALGRKETAIAAQFRDDFCCRIEFAGGAPAID
jgi:hypothetical protein